MNCLTFVLISSLAFMFAACSVDSSESSATFSPNNPVVQPEDNTENKKIGVLE